MKPVDDTLNSAMLSLHDELLPAMDQAHATVLAQIRASNRRRRLIRGLSLGLFTAGALATAVYMFNSGDTAIAPAVVQQSTTPPSAQPLKVPSAVPPAGMPTTRPYSHVPRMAADTAGPFTPDDGVASIDDGDPYITERTALLERASAASDRADHASAAVLFEALARLSLLHSDTVDAVRMYDSLEYHESLSGSGKVSRMLQRLRGELRNR